MTKKPSDTPIGPVSGEWRSILVFAAIVCVAMVVFALRSAQNVEFVYGGL